MPHFLHCWVDSVTQNMPVIALSLAPGRMLMVAAVQLVFATLASAVLPRPAKK